MVYSKFQNKRVLMDNVENEEDERKSILSFRINFNARYESLLGFQAYTFNQMTNFVLNCDNEKGLLAIYLHKDIDIYKNNFFPHIFASSISKAKVCEYLNDKFSLWGFDCTSNSNAEYMQQLLNANSIYYDLEFRQNLPALLIVGRLNGINSILNIITINTVDIRAELENSYNQYKRLV